MGRAAIDRGVDRKLRDRCDQPAARGEDGLGHRCDRAGAVPDPCNDPGPDRRPKSVSSSLKGASHETHPAVFCPCVLWCIEHVRRPSKQVEHPEAATARLVIFSASTCSSVAASVRTRPAMHARASWSNVQVPSKTSRRSTQSFQRSAAHVDKGNL